MSPVRYRIRNWERFQHYKHRNPPWIKLHVEIFSSADWVMLDDASKLLAVACMVIAAKHDGCVPDAPDYIKRVAYLRATPNLKPLIACGFLEILQADASACKQLRTNAVPETETEKKENIQSAATQTDGLFEQFWTAYPREKNMSKKRALMAWRKLSAEKRAQAAAAVPGYRSYCEKNKSWYHTIHAERFLSHEKFEGFAAEHQPTPDEIADATDRADKLLKRGKYAETYQ